MFGALLQGFVASTYSGSLYITFSNSVQNWKSFRIQVFFGWALLSTIDFHKSHMKPKPNLLSHSIAHNTFFWAKG